MPFFSEVRSHTKNWWFFGRDRTTASQAKSFVPSVSADVAVWSRVGLNGSRKRLS